MNKLYSNQIEVGNISGRDDIKDKFELTISLNSDPRFKNSVISLEGLKLSYTNPKNSSFLKKLELLKYKLLQKYSQEIDPLVYIANLHYGELIPINKIVEILNHMGVSFNKRSFSAILSQKCYWNLGVENSPITRKKLTSKKARQKNISNLYPNHLQKKLEGLGEYINEIKNKVDLLINFDIDKFNKLPNKKMKILYLLKLKYGIGINELKKTHKGKVFSKNQIIGGKVMAVFFKKELQAFLSQNGIILNFTQVDFEELLGLNYLKKNIEAKRKKRKKLTHIKEIKRGILNEILIKHKVLNINDGNFDNEHFNKLPHSYEKLLYILEINYGIDKEDIKSIYYKGISEYLMIEVFEEKLKDFFKKNKVNFKIELEHFYTILDKRGGNLKTIEEVENFILNEAINKVKKIGILIPFDIKIFNGKKSKKEQLLYIIETQLHLTIKDLKILRYTNGIGQTRMKNFFEDKLNDFFKTNKINFNITKDLIEIILI